MVRVTYLHLIYSYTYNTINKRGRVTMKKNKRNPFIALSFLVIILLSFIVNKPNEISENNNSETNQSAQREVMTKESLKTLILNSKEFDVDKQEKDRLVISFYTSSCPYCKQQAELFEKYREDLNYEVFYVPYKEEYESAKENILDLDYGIDSDRILIDPDGEFAEKFNINATPTSIFVDKKKDSVKGLVGLTKQNNGNNSDGDYINHLFDLLTNPQQ